MYKAFLIFLSLALPASAMADDFNYDDDDTPSIDVSEDDWGNGGNIDVDIDEDLSGAGNISCDAAAKVMVSLCGGSVVIDAGMECEVPVYNLGASALLMVKVPAGRNILDLPRGIYIIGGKKYLLQ